MTLCFFFLKKKTGYEMRISDWSSDVYSSDLVDQADDVGNLLGAVLDAADRGDRIADHAAALFRGIAGGDRQLVGGLGVLGILFHRRGDLVHRGGRLLDGGGLAFRALGEILAERKSVVSGKRVSVRVDLGGRRIITKK